MNIRYTRFVLPALLTLAGILFLSYALDELIARSSTNWFSKSDIKEMDNLTGSKDDVFWVRESPTSFVMKAGADEDSALKIEFLNTGLYRFQLGPHKLKPICGAASGADNFHLSVESADGNVSTIHASATSGSKLELKLAKGDILKFKLSKNKLPECGRGLLRISKFDAYYTIGIISAIAMLIAFAVAMVALGKEYMLPIGFAMIYGGVYVESLHYVSGVPVSGVVLVTFITVISLVLYMYLIHSVGSRSIGIRISVSFLGLAILVIIFSPLLIELSYNLLFDIKMGRAAWFAIYQTNYTEAIEYLTNAFRNKGLVLASLVAVVAILSKKPSSPVRQSGRQAILATVFMLLTIAVVPASSATYGSVFSSYRDYRQEINDYIQQRRLRTNSKLSVTATKQQQQETYIIVIGESLNKNHMGLWGYTRQTTPLLSQILDELLLHQASFSNHTHTMPVLKLALTSANQANVEDYFNSPSLIEVANKAGFETYWLSTQAKTGRHETPLSVLTEEASHVEFIDGDDHELLPLIGRVVDKPSDKNRLIFVHLTGSHVQYCNRFPKNFEFYSKNYSLQTSYTGYSLNSHLIDLINCYDSSINYNDYVISEFIKAIDKNPAQPAGLIYFSDHGEDVYGFKNHDSDQFTYNMIEIPLLFWLSDSYKDRYLNKVQTLKSHLVRPFTNDSIYDTVLGVIGVEADYYQATGDLTNKKYKDSLITLHGKKIIDLKAIDLFHESNQAIKQYP